ncbi:MAG TPA: SAM-dependent methyltransferase, partial [Rhodobiaceae bacterium]|nr:SAM-dependent methyltransferase [Rhodobiaceae bacterium]
EVVGVTLSHEQLKVAQRRAEERGLADKVEFRLQDYRLIKENFDRVVSVGMFEHVGVGHYREYFDGVMNLLTHDGVALIHTIGRLDGPGSTNPWIAKYIFPGG